MRRHLQPAASADAALDVRLAAAILERARKDGLPPGAHLREQQLAEAFRVSRTPIRRALQALAGSGHVTHAPNRGFFLRRLPAAAAAVADEADDDPLYARIADEHLDARLPERVTESELARRYGVTRARLQRPLARLVREGLLERLPGHGWAFLPVLRSPEAFAQGYRFRALIEPAALHEPGYHLPAEVAARLRARAEALLRGGWKNAPRSEALRAGAEFHEAIVAASGNPFLIDAIRRVNRMRQLLERRIAGTGDRARLARTADDHLRILDMIEAGDREGAAHLLRAHLWQELRAKRGA
jgi:DNA-binding GntR family transcriptional regulator